MGSTRAAIPKILRNANSSVSLLRGFGSDPQVSCAAGNFDNRHVEIVCAASAHVNVSVLYQFVDTAKRPWPIRVTPRQESPRSGSAWLGRSQKDGLPTCHGEGCISRLKAINSRKGEGAAWSLPLSNREREWTPRRAMLLCSPPCRSSAEASPGVGVTLFWVRSFLCSV